MPQNSTVDRLSLYVKQVVDMMEVLSLPLSEREHFASLSTTIFGILRERAAAKANAEMRDYRLKAILLKGCRKYGDTGDKDYDYYGLRCHSDSGLYKGLFLLGDNGSGKSSIFDAAEFLMTHKVGEAKYRNRTNVKRYMVNENHTSVDILSFTSEKSLTFNSEISAVQSLPIEKFFISENSIYEAFQRISQDDNWLGYYCYLIGIDCIYEMVTSGLPSRLMEGIHTAFELLEKRREAVNKMEIAVDNISVQRLGCGEQIRKLAKNVSDILQQFDNGDKNRKSLSELIDRLADIPVGLDLFCINRFKQDFKDCEQAYVDMLEQDRRSELAEGEEPDINQGDETNKRLTELYSKLVENIKGFVDRLHQLIESEPIQDVRPFFDIAKEFQSQKVLNAAAVQINEDKIAEIENYLRLFERYLCRAMYKAVSEIVDAKYIRLVTDMMNSHFLQPDENFVISLLMLGGRITVTVNDIPINSYFNTFRLRLFMLISQAALCLSFVNRYKINFPIILDDVFYANDYMNKAQLVKYFKVIYEYASSQSGNAICPQIIFFSHDEQLITTLADVYSSKKSYMFGRILPLRELYNMRRTRETIGNMKYLNIYAPIFQKP